MDPFDFDMEAGLEPREFPFKQGGVDYILIEATESAHTAYQEALSEKITLYGTAEVQARPAPASDSVLVAGCTITAQKREPVPLATVRFWPRRVVSKLYERAKEMSGIEQPETVEEIDRRIQRLTKLRERVAARGSPSKNSPSATAGTSA